MRYFMLMFGVVASLVWMSLAPSVANAQECPQTYKPVCGVVESEKRIATFSNSCTAKMAGALVLHTGKCQGPGEARCPHNSAAPVCAKNSAGEKTYDNLCWAEKDWAVLVHKGACTAK